MPLVEVVGQLRRRGVTVPTATLSTWQSGRSVPARHASVLVILALEDVPGLGTGGCWAAPA